MLVDWLILAVLVAMLAQYERDSRYLRQIARCVCKIAGQAFPLSVTVTQVAAPSAGGIPTGAQAMANGVPLGGSGNFLETPQPAGSAFPSGTSMQWSCDDTNATLTPTADGTGVNVAIPATDTATQLTVTFTGTLAGQSATGSLTVPVLPAVVPFPSSVVVSQAS